MTATGLFVIPTGLEPVAYRLEICCTIHCATGPTRRKSKNFRNAKLQSWQQKFQTKV